MRCTKCGNISWDHTSVCNACGQDLSAQRDLLGHFPQPDPDFSWFDSVTKRSALPDESKPPVDLSEIDVSDLVQKETASSQADTEPPPDIDLDEIDEIVEDEELQKVLDKGL